MARRDEVAEAWQRQKAERVRCAREKQHAKVPAHEPDIEQTMADLHSTDETTPARAARELCPCRTDWDVFEQTLDTLRRMTKIRAPWSAPTRSTFSRTPSRWITRGFPPLRKRSPTRWRPAAGRCAGGRKRGDRRQHGRQAQTERSPAGADRGR